MDAWISWLLGEVARLGELDSDVYPTAVSSHPGALAVDPDLGIGDADCTAILRPRASAEVRLAVPHHNDVVLGTTWEWSSRDVHRVACQWTRTPSGLPNVFHPSSAINIHRIE